ncbi:hypothetical protein M422DRAFT_36787 [Sphaerobolus stellatus SS14]|uniref:Uncharacterized protein n=1 Tax=Sphaerobolus stellatus (strain SS14) TaxID=990650 RepID=A0A0C9UM31_SPHS4|nr:hypothetical protein M422DRAFT_36787 [Sphaerobolus stellatus SS14]
MGLHNGDTGMVLGIIWGSLTSSTALARIQLRYALSSLEWAKGGVCCFAGYGDRATRIRSVEWRYNTDTGCSGV